MFNYLGRLLAYWDRKQRYPVHTGEFEEDSTLLGSYLDGEVIYGTMYAVFDPAKPEQRQDQAHLKHFRIQCPSISHRMQHLLLHKLSLIFLDKLVRNVITLVCMFRSPN